MPDMKAEVRKLSKIYQISNALIRQQNILIRFRISYLRCATDL